MTNAPRRACLPNLWPALASWGSGARLQGVAGARLPDVREEGADGVVQHCRQHLALQPMGGPHTPCTAAACSRLASLEEVVTMRITAASPVLQPALITCTGMP